MQQVIRTEQIEVPIRKKILFNSVKAKNLPRKYSDFEKGKIQEIFEIFRDFLRSRKSTSKSVIRHTQFF